MGVYCPYVMGELNEPSELKDAESGETFVITFDDDGEIDTLTADYRKPTDGGSQLEWDVGLIEVVSEDSGYVVTMVTNDRWKFDVVDISPADDE